MRSRSLWVFWGLLAVGASISGFLAQADWPENGWVIPALIGVWLVTISGFRPFAFAAPLEKLLQGLRSRPLLFWLLILVYLTLGVGMWLANHQPTYGRALTALEYCYLAVLAWGFLFLLCYGASADEYRAIGRKVGQSRLSGMLITLSMLLILFFMAEGYLRIFYITTDAYGFTAMNYHWYNNFYWGRYNSYGYRDHEPVFGDEANPIQQIAVVGDSFAVGHGIDNLDDTFTQLLEQHLGEGYNVNLVAHSGWDTDVIQGYVEGFTQSFPAKVDALVLSYYLNDIDYLLEGDDAINPDAAFSFPEDPLIHQFVLNFFTPNFLYYNLMQYTSPARTGNHFQRLIDAYTNDATWNYQAGLLNQFVDWTEANDIQLIVLLWPQITALDESLPATERVHALMEARGVPVVNLTEPLRGHNPLELIVNAFDTHPSIKAHAIAADALYPVVLETLR
jgi:hypothetical protein